MEVANINSVLPEELLEMVLLLLPLRDLKSALLVCRLWRKVGERSKFWAWVSLRVNELNLSVMPQVLGIERFKSAKMLVVRAVSNKLLMQIERHTGLKILDAFMKCDMSSIGSSLLARVVAQLEEAWLGDAKLTTQQCKKIFKFASRDCKLKKLNVDGNDLSTVDPEFLASVVAKLEDVHLGETELIPQQCEEIFMFASRDCKIKKLNMCTNNLSTVDLKTLAGVIAKLEEVNLIDTELTFQQCQAIFRFAASDCKLKILDIWDNDLSSVDPKTLAVVVAKVEEVGLGYTELIPQQCEAIFRLAANDCKLKRLDMAGNDLDSVDPETLALVVAKLEDLDLTKTKLTTQQCQAIFRFAANDCKLKRLDMDGNDLASVDPETLAVVAVKLEEVDLTGTNLTTEQMMSILAHVQEDSKLKELSMGGNSTVDEKLDVVRNAREILGDGLTLT